MTFTPLFRHELTLADKHGVSLPVSYIGFEASCVCFTELQMGERDLIW
jgi:hypothetical protein